MNRSIVCEGGGGPLPTGYFGVILWVVVCLLSIAMSVKTGMKKKRERERSQCNFLDAQRVRIRFYMELKNSIYFIALCDRRQSTRLTVWPCASRFAAYLQLAGEEH